MKADAVLLVRPVRKQLLLAGECNLQMDRNHSATMLSAMQHRSDVNDAQCLAQCWHVSAVFPNKQEISSMLWEQGEATRKDKMKQD